MAIPGGCDEDLDPMCHQPPDPRYEDRPDDYPDDERDFDWNDAPDGAEREE